MIADRIRTSDLAVDRQLADVAGSFRFLLDVTPINVDVERGRFLTGEVDEPEFVYRPLDDDPAVLEEQLNLIDLGSVEDRTLSHLLQQRHRELSVQVEMLRCRGSEAFRSMGVELYGAVSPALLDEALRLLTHIEVPDIGEADLLDARQMADCALAELATYRDSFPDLDANVVVRPDVTGVLVTDGDLIVGRSARVPRWRIHALLQHEIGTHVLTFVNGSHQPIRLMAQGLAGYDETQEGLAVLAEHLVGGLGARRMRQLAARVLAVHLMLEGRGFRAIHGELTSHGLGAREAFRVTMRAVRGGGLAKDAAYLRGLHDLLGRLAAGFDLGVLWLGKLSLDAAPLVEELAARGVLAPPVLIPTYLGEPAVQERLERVRAGVQLKELIGEPA